MLVLRDPALAGGISDPEIRQLVVSLFTEICDGQPYEVGVHGYVIVVEPGDTVEALEEESTCRIVQNRCDDIRFGDKDFSPSFEFVTEHAGCYEMVFVICDDGYGVVLYIPKIEGIDSELRKLCVQYAEPSPELTPTAK